MALGNERVAWFNGRIVRESEVLIPFRDQGFLRGDAVFDMTRSFNGKAFRLEEHVTRLYRSLKYLDIDPGLSPAEMAARIIGSPSASAAASVGSPATLGTITARMSSSTACRCRCASAPSTSATASTS
jgi:branched-subunit amino acid aminotransferase/4-amino-4-deoxychorismate lyase